MKIVSLFSGCGGLDQGFKNAGFSIIWANDFDKHCHSTYRHNHPETKLDTRSIVNIPSNDIPDSDGIIGGPPCQAWSAAGSNGGVNDKRGQVFYEYLRVIDDKSPKFFVIENVEGILRSTHKEALKDILSKLGKLGKNGYDIYYKLLNAKNYEVPQDRKRVFFVGIDKKLVNKKSKKSIEYVFPSSSKNKITIKDVIYHLRDLAKSHKKFVKNKSDSSIDNYYLESDWSPQFMTRNRVREWDEVAFTVPASGRHVTMHPQAPKMVKVTGDKFQFKKGSENLYRRFTIRECANLQTFPDDFEFVVDDVNQAYKLIGNAVPVKLAESIANSIRLQL